MTSEAQHLLRQGRLAEAERLCARVLESAPNDIEALNIVALAALRDGQTIRAVRLLERAVQVNPQDAMTQHHLGRAHEKAGDFSAAARAHESAVQARPEFYVARLHLAAMLDRIGDSKHAVFQYARALKNAQAEGRWLNVETTPAPLVPLVETAVRAVRTGRRAAFFDSLAPLIARYGRGSIERIAQALRIYLGEEAAVYPDARQKPTFLFIPGMPAAPYLEHSLFSWIEMLESATEAIQQELGTLLPSSQGRERVFNSDALEKENLRGGLDVPPSWNGYYFYRHGVKRTENCESCPATATALEALPLAHIREHGPEVLYSVFTPGTHLLPHRGVTNARLVGHLPLIIPSDCALRVGGEIHEWKVGHAVVFDDTYEHEAWNRSDQTRVVMIFDVWSPYLTDAERSAVTELIGAIGDFRSSLESG